MNISDTFYIALCMTILIIGVVYWFWTQTQHLQRKINLLENIVYEFKASMVAPNHESPVAQESSYPPAVMEEDDDLLHETLHSDISPALPPMQDSEESPGATVSLSDDLQPGGVGSGLDELMTPEPKIKASALEGMTLKELRRLAEQRNIPNASGLRKQALIEALRGETKAPTAAVSSATTTNVAATSNASPIGADDIAPMFEPSRVELQ
jgi:Rho termination factor, N-terminal domain